MNQKQSSHPKKPVSTPPNSISGNLGVSSSQGSETLDDELQTQSPSPAIRDANSPEVDENVEQSNPQSGTDLSNTNQQPRH